MLPFFFVFACKILICDCFEFNNEIVFICFINAYMYIYFCDIDLSNLAMETDVSPTRGGPDKRPGERKSIGPEHLRPLPDSLTFDIRNVQAMTEIKTHIGYAKAFIRLSLEKKVLSRHLKNLLSDTGLLR